MYIRILTEEITPAPKVTALHPLLFKRGRCQRVELRSKMRKGFRTVVVANSVKSKWAKVAAEGSDIEEGGKQLLVTEKRNVAGAGWAVKSVKNKPILNGE